MDQPRHGPQRKTVAPMFTPTHLDNLAIAIRERSASCLDKLTRNETFDWVDKVSIELTTQMLAVLFDFPWEERRKLTRWSDVATATIGGGVVDTEEQRQPELRECAEYFMRLWNERIKPPPRANLGDYGQDHLYRAADGSSICGSVVPIRETIAGPTGYRLLHVVPSCAAICPRSK
jgi:cytochrome P450